MRIIATEVIARNPQAVLIKQTHRMLLCLGSNQERCERRARGQNRPNEYFRFATSKSESSRPTLSLMSS